MKSEEVEEGGGVTCWWAEAVEIKGLFSIQNDYSIKKKKKTIRRYNEIAISYSFRYIYRLV